MSINQSKIIIITGPTGSGKTRLAHSLYERGDIIINADSRQIYKQINIGVAKSSQEEIKKYNYQLIDFLPLTQSFSAFNFLKFASKIIFDNSNARIFVVGGSNFYLESLEMGLPTSSLVSSEKMNRGEKKITTQVEEEYLARQKQISQDSGNSKRDTTDALAFFLTELKEKDREYFDRVDKNNPRRVLRAISYIRCHGKTFTSYRQQRNKKADFDILKFILYPSREKMYANINNNVKKMFLSGWVEEVIALKKKYSKEFEKMLVKSGLTSIGYLEILQYLRGQVSFPDCVSIIQQKTRKFAKRQITWLKKEKGVFLTEKIELQIKPTDPMGDQTTDEKKIKNKTVVSEQEEWILKIPEFSGINLKNQTKLESYQLSDIKNIIKEFQNQ